MNVEAIEVPYDQARAQIEEYKAALRERFDRSDDAILRGLQQIVKGRRVIDVEAAIGGAGLDGQNRPKFAICRADAQFVYFSHEGSHSGQRGPTFCRSRFTDGRSKQFATYWMFRRDLFHDALRAHGWTDTANPPYFSGGGLRAIVPTIPPRFRPRGSLNKYLILWEADWHTAPGDPLLLRHIAGNLCAVLAAWDLTPLERAVLAGERSALR